MSWENVYDPPVLDTTAKEMVAAFNSMANSLKRSADAAAGLASGIYGFCIDQDSSVTGPDAKVTYTDDAVGYTPFVMDMSTGVPDYGSWENAFFMPKPCMLKFDGTVDYYLDPTDYTKKLEGGPSDVADPTYGGNAMMEWPVIYVSRTEQNNKIYVKISNKRIDGSYYCWANINKNGDIRKFYTPIYNGSLIDNKLRSISGQVIMKSKNAEQEMTYAAANGDGWNIETFADRMLINDLLILMCKSTDPPSKFGQGFISGGTSDNMINTGSANDKGLFYGLSDTGTPVKVFGMENYWGQQFRRLVGWMFVNGVQKVKLTHGVQDGSTTVGYNRTGDGYITLGAYPTGSSGYIKTQKASKYGEVPYELAGSATTHYCDYCYINTEGTRMAYVGGASSYGAGCGPFYVALGDTPSSAGWSIGASPSYKPTA